MSVSFLTPLEFILIIGFYTVVIAMSPTSLDFNELGWLIFVVFHGCTKCKLRLYLHLLDGNSVHNLSSRLDYCNALYLGISQASLGRLQLVQNAAARLLTGTNRRQHITPVLKSLHWLPVHFRIDFKILMFVFKALTLLYIWLSF